MALTSGQAETQGFHSTGHWFRKYETEELNKKLTDLKTKYPSCKFIKVKTLSDGLSRSDSTPRGGINGYRIHADKRYRLLESIERLMPTVNTMTYDLQKFEERQATEKAEFLARQQELRERLTNVENELASLNKESL